MAPPSRPALRWSSTSRRPGRAGALTSDSLQVTDEHLEDPSVDLRLPCQYAGPPGLVVPEEELEAVERPQGGLRVERDIQEGEQPRRALRAGGDALLRGLPVEAAHGLEQEVQEVEPGRGR